MDNITDFQLLATAANYIKNDLVNENSDWNKSPFKWVLTIPAGSKGKLGKHLIFQWCALKGLPVDRNTNSEADMQINHHKVEVKFSTLWKSGIYKFQQIRDQDYEFCVFLGISPTEAHCWVVKKSLLIRYVIGHLGQHTGASGTDTAWISIDPNNPPDWIIPCGGNLESAFRVINSLCH